MMPREFPDRAVRDALVRPDKLERLAPLAATNRVE